MGNAAQTKPPTAGGGGAAESKTADSDPNDAGYVWGELQSQNQELPNNIELRLNKITIGRRKDNTFSISGPLISGHHCVITRQVYEGTDAIEVFHIKDESQNGTFLDGVSIGKGNQKVLRHGATVALPWRVTKQTGETEDKLISACVCVVFV
jgi:pSer/pThr/pTyr-binding forkhead associated (FHA) protein